MTEIVSSPPLARSSVKRAASATGRISICRPSVSCVGQLALDLLEDLGVVRAALVEPEHRRRAGRARPLDREPHPVRHRGVLGLAAAPDVAGLDVVLEQGVAGAVDHAHGAGGGDLEVLSWLPYSSAFCAIRPTFGVVPIVAGSNAPCSRQKSIVSAYSAA